MLPAAPPDAARSARRKRWRDGIERSFHGDAGLAPDITGTLRSAAEWRPLPRIRIRREGRYPSRNLPPFTGSSKTRPRPIPGFRSFRCSGISLPCLNLPSSRMKFPHILAYLAPVSSYIVVCHNLCDMQSCLGGRIPPSGSPRWPADMANVTRGHAILPHAVGAAREA